MINKSSSRKWKITKYTFILANLIGISLIGYSISIGPKTFLAVLPMVLSYLGAVNSLTAVAYNGANAYAKRWDNESN